FDKSQVEGAGAVFQQRAIHLDTGSFQTAQASARNARIGVFHAVDHTTDACGNQRLSAGAGAASVVAGLKGDIGGSAPGSLTRLLQGVHLGMGSSGAIVPALSE